ncbi:MAG: hypothetical protein WD534_11220 [Phycisphaeraceae bacterium]
MKARTDHDERRTPDRHWHDLKPGDVIFFGTGWYEIFDAYPVTQDTVLVKLIIAPGRYETHRVRTHNSKAMCQA